MFGRIASGGSSKRIVEVSNTLSTPVKIAFRAEGSIVPLLSFQKAVTLEPGEMASVEFSASAGNRTTGNYSGTVTATIVRTF